MPAFFLVIKKDIVEQSTGYLVRAKDKDHAAQLVDKGMYIEETATETMDHISTETVTVTELSLEAEGQQR